MGEVVYQHKDGLSLTLSSDELEMIEAVRRYCTGELLPFVRSHGPNYIPPETMRKIFKRLSEFGFVNGPLNAESGGLGISLKMFGLILEEVCRVSASVGTAALIQTLMARAFVNLATSDLRERYLQRILDCDLLGCIAISEPDVGSNVAEIKCKAVEVDGGYSISGSKSWISNGDYSDFCFCVARTGESPLTLDLFFVDRAVSPYDVRNIHKMGLNETSTAQVFFDNCVVPTENRLTFGGQGMRQVSILFAVSRPLTGVISVGIARAALDAAIEYSKVRTQHGKAIAGHQLVSAALGEMATHIDAARLLVLRALDMCDRGVRCDAEAAMSKWFASEMAVDVTSKAIQIHGANGIATEYEVERLFREARIFPIPEGTTEINKLIVGRALTGISAF
jgi:alkylation response protein AidB-like acyl-CoA dehydrogenase